MTLARIVGMGAYAPKRILTNHDLEKLIERLGAIDDLDLTLTTNGSVLRRLAGSLRAAGLQRVADLHVGEPPGEVLRHDRLVRARREPPGRR